MYVLLLWGYELLIIERVVWLYVRVCMYYVCICCVHMVMNVAMYVCVCCVVCSGVLCI